MGIRVLGLNSGLGVSLWPFKEQLLANLETRRVFHTKCNGQWQANFDQPLYKDFKELEGLLITLPKRPNVVISSPDCGAGSVLRYSRAKELGDNKKNLSLLQFIEAVNLIKPKFFLFENLDALFKSIPENEFDQSLSNYHLVKHRVPVSAFGNSQVTRKRLVIVGVKKSLPNANWARIFKIPHKLNAPKRCSELYGDLNGQSIGIAHVREPETDMVTMYAGYKISIGESKVYWQTKLLGKRRWEVKSRKFSTAPGVYRNNLSDYPSTARKASRQFDHNGEMLTPRQLARIQGIPDEFKLIIDPKNFGYWVNKARLTVTKSPPMEISVWFKRSLEKYYKDRKGVYK